MGISAFRSHIKSMKLVREIKKKQLKNSKQKKKFSKCESGWIRKLAVVSDPYISNYLMENDLLKGKLMQI